MLGCCGGYHILKPCILKEFGLRGRDRRQGSESQFFVCMDPGIPCKLSRASLAHSPLDEH